MKLFKKTNAAEQSGKPYRACLPWSIVWWALGLFKLYGLGTLHWWSCYPILLFCAAITAVSGISDYRHEGEISEKGIAALIAGSICFVLMLIRIYFLTKWNLPSA